MTGDLDEDHRGWLRDLLDQAAASLHVEIIGEPRYGWRDRTVGATATTEGGETRWLRLVTELPYWSGGAFWNGNIDANAVHGVAKPRVVAWRDWTEGGRDIRVN